jgi:predicted nucleic acid-binding Zn ribbon protein
MPRYVFRCPKCGNEVEISQTVKEHEQFVPMCVVEGCDGQQHMRTVIHPATLVFRGTGWTSKG